MKILFWKLKGLSDSAQSGLWVSGIAAAAAYLRLLAVFCEGRADREKERERVCVRVCGCVCGWVGGGEREKERKRRGSTLPSLILAAV